MSKQVTIVQSDDGEYEGLYVDGVCKAQDDRLSAYHVLEALDIGYHTVECDTNWLCDRMDGFPDDLREVKDKVEIDYLPKVQMFRFNAFEFEGHESGTDVVALDMDHAIRLFQSGFAQKIENVKCLGEI